MSRPRALALGAALLAVACADGLGPRYSRRLSLGIVPVFDGMSPQEGAPADVDSFVVAVTNPPDTVPVDTSVRALPGQDSIVLTLNVELDGAVDTLRVRFDGYNAATGRLLYSGSDSLTARPGITASSAPVNAAYVGPGRNVRSLEVLPATVALRPGETAQLSYTAFDSAGAVLPDDSVPVRYASSSRSVAEVNQSGLVSAVGAGSAVVLVTTLASSTVRDTVEVTVAAVPPPLIGLERTAVTFNDTVATTSPTPQTIAVTNAGGGVLTGLSVGTITYGAGATGWLTATLDASTAPATLTLTVSNTGLREGTYTATVPVEATGVANSPEIIRVTFSLHPPVLASIQAAPGFTVLRPGDTVRVQVSGKNAIGEPIPVTGITFTSRSTGVATVGSSTGLITAVAGGTAVVVAEASGFRDSALVAVAARGATVVSAVADDRGFDQAKVGDTVRVLIAVDLRGVAPERLGSYDANLSWTASVLRYVRVENLGTGALQSPLLNPLNTSGGVLMFGAADPNGVGGAFGLIRVIYVAQAAGTSALTLELDDLSAAGTFTDLLPAALRIAGQVRVQP